MVNIATIVEEQLNKLAAHYASKAKVAESEVKIFTKKHKGNVVFWGIIKGNTFFISKQEIEKVLQPPFWLKAMGIIEKIISAFGKVLETYEVMHNSEVAIACHYNPSSLNLYLEGKFERELQREEIEKIIA